MALNTALSGILGAQDGLNVISNNLANASTTGFKAGSAEFQAIYPTGSANAPGEGVSQQFIQQDYAQGNLQTTGSPLDLAIQGNGFFVVQKAGQNVYTRDGAFQLSPAGQIQNASGNPVLGFGVNANGSLNGILQPLSVSTVNQPAHATATAGLSAALNSADPVISSAFNPAISSTYDQSTSVVAYDSLGNANHVQLYFTKNPYASGSASGAKPNKWSIYAQPQNANGSSVGSATKLTTLGFNTNGTLASGGSATLNVNWANGATPSKIAFNFSGTTLGAQQFSIGSVTNDGYAPGQFTGTQISQSGAVQSTYSNGQKQTVGMLSVANFINNQGLIPSSNNMFVASQTSGQPVLNTPGAGVSGNLVSGSLEESNTQTSNELVGLLKFQEAYQANTSVLQGVQQDTQKLLQL